VTANVAKSNFLSVFRNYSTRFAWLFLKASYTLQRNSLPSSARTHWTHSVSGWIFSDDDEQHSAPFRRSDAVMYECHDYVFSRQRMGVARGCTGCTFTATAEKIFWPNLQGKVVSAPPPRQRVHPRYSESRFLGNWGDLDGGSGYLGSFSLRFEGDD